MEYKGPRLGGDGGKGKEWIENGNGMGTGTGVPRNGRGSIEECQKNSEKRKQENERKSMTDEKRGMDASFARVCE